MMIEKYPNPRRMHCETGVLVNMLEYYGVKLSEPMALGIGGGMFFLYFPWLKANGFDLLVLRTFPGSIVQHFANRTHLGYHEMTFGNNMEKGQKALDELVSKNIPVGLVVNLRDLPFLEDIGIKIDFNGHNLTVIGKEGTDYVLVETHEMRTTDDYPRLDETQLTLARFHKGFGAPHGRLYYLDPLPQDFLEKADMKSAIVKGIEETCRNMLSIPTPWTGYRGIHYFAKKVRQMDNKLSQKQIKQLFFWYYTMIEQGGTGGAGYRYMYSTFLKEAAPIVQSEVVDNCSVVMNHAADSWRAFTIGCNRYIKDSGVTLKEIAEFIDEAGNLEHETFMNLKKKFLKNAR